MYKKLSKIGLTTFLFLSFVIFADKEKPVNVKNNTETKPQNGKKAVSPKIAYVNVHKIITLDPRLLDKAANEWKDLYAKLQETVKPANKEIEDMQKHFESKRNEGIALQRSQIVSQEALRKKYEELAELDATLRRRVQDTEQFVQNELNKYQTQVGVKVENSIKQLKTSQGWDLVIRGDLVLASEPNFDLTDQVLQIINKDYAEEKKKKEAETKKLQTKEPVKLG